MAKKTPKKVKEDEYQFTNSWFDVAKSTWDIFFKKKTQPKF